MLSQRQKEILVRIPFYSNGQIAEQLGMGRNEVKNKLRTIYKRLNVPDLPENEDKRLFAVVKALQEEEITFDDLAVLGHSKTQIFNRRR